MTQSDQQLDGMGEQQRPGRADADQTGQDMAIGGNDGTPGAERLGMRGGSNELGGGANQQATDSGMNASSVTADESGEVPANIDTGRSVDGMDMAGQANAGGQSGALGTCSGTDRSDVPGGGLSGGMDTGDMTGTGGQTDAGQEGANIQP